MDLRPSRIRPWDADWKVETEHRAFAVCHVNGRRHKGSCLPDNCWPRNAIDLSVEGGCSHPAFSRISTPIRMNDHPWKHEIRCSVTICSLRTWRNRHCFTGTRWFEIVRSAVPDKKERPSPALICPELTGIG